MSELESPYNPGDVVWVKLRSFWWPGQVVDFDVLPDDIKESLKRPPLVTVAFFQEDSYEFVKTLKNICIYNCSKKDDFIKKGMDMHRAKHAIMEKFPGDVCTAEKKTNGNIHILSDPKYGPPQKFNYNELFGTPNKKKTPLKGRGRHSGGKMTTPKQKTTPKHDPIVTHPRFVGSLNDHQVRVMVQQSVPKEKSASANNYKCKTCGFAAARLDLIALHNKMHKRAPAPKRVPKMARSKTSSIEEDLERLRQGLPLEEVDSDDDEDEDEEEEEEAPPPPKKRKPKIIKKTPKKPKKEKVVEEKPVKKLDIHDDLLAEWDDDIEDEVEDVKMDTTETDSNETGKDSDKKEIDTSQTLKDVSTEKDTCFDFDDDDENNPETASPGPKISRIVPAKSKSTEEANVPTEEAANLPVKNDEAKKKSEESGELEKSEINDISTEETTDNPKEEINEAKQVEDAGKDEAVNKVDEIKTAENIKSEVSNEKKPKRRRTTSKAETESKEIKIDDSSIKTKEDEVTVKAGEDSSIGEPSQSTTSNELAEKPEELVEKPEEEKVSEDLIIKDTSAVKKAEDNAAVKKREEKATGEDKSNKTGDDKSIMNRDEKLNKRDDKLVKNRDDKSVKNRDDKSTKSRVEKSVKNRDEKSNRSRDEKSKSREDKSTSRSRDDKSIKSRDEKSKSHDEKTKSHDEKSKSHDEKSKGHDEKSKAHDEKSKSYEKSKSHDSSSKSRDDKSSSKNEKSAKKGDKSYGKKSDERSHLKKADEKLGKTSEDKSCKKGEEKKSEGKKAEEIVDASIEKSEDNLEKIDDQQMDVDKEDESELEMDAFKEIFETTTVPKLPEIPQLPKYEQNFHSTKSIKFPDKGKEAAGGASSATSGLGVATKLTNPKKRFVKSFEDFEQSLREKEAENKNGKKEVIEDEKEVAKEEKTVAEKSTKQENVLKRRKSDEHETSDKRIKIDELDEAEDEKPKADKKSFPILSKLKSQLMTKLTEPEVERPAIKEKSQTKSAEKEVSKSTSRRLSLQTQEAVTLKKVEKIAVVQEKVETKPNIEIESQNIADNKQETPETEVTETEIKEDDVKTVEIEAAVEIQEPADKKEEIEAADEEMEFEATDATKVELNTSPIKEVEINTSENEIPEDTFEVKAAEAKQDTIETPEEEIKETEVKEPEVQKVVVEEPDIQELVLDKPEIEKPMAEQVDIEKPIVEEPEVQLPLIQESDIPKSLIEVQEIQNLFVEEPEIHNLMGEETLNENLIVEEPDTEKLMTEELVVPNLVVEEQVVEHVEEPDLQSLIVKEPDLQTLLIEEVEVKTVETVASDVKEPEIVPPEIKVPEYKEQDMFASKEEKIDFDEIAAITFETTVALTESHPVETKQVEETCGLSTLAAVSELSTLVTEKKELDIDKNVTVVSESDLGDGQVEIANVPIIEEGTVKEATIVDFMGADSILEKSSEVLQTLKQPEKTEIVPVVLETKIEPVVEKIVEPEPQSKLLKMLSDNRPSQTYTSQLKIANPKFELTKEIMKPKPKLVFKTAAAATSKNKPVILSEKIIKPAVDTGGVSVQKVTSKRSFDDLEDIDAYIIQKPTKKPIIDEATELQMIPKKPIARNKATILDHTIITPAGKVVTQPQQRIVQSVTQTQPKPQVQSDDNIFDIDSMPIVLTDQILTAESLENITAPTPVKKIQQPQVKLLNKSATPTIMKETLVKPTKSYTKVVRKSLPTANVLKHTPTIVNQTPKSKYVLVSEATPPTSKYTVGKRQIIKKSPAILATTSNKVQNVVQQEPTGNKIMILTNSQGQQSRVVLTPAQQKMMGMQTGTVKKTFKTIPQKEPIKNTNIISQTIISSKGQISTTSQPVYAPTTSLMPVRKPRMEPIRNKILGQKVVLQSGMNQIKSSSGQPRTIIIKNPQGQTVKRIHGTDDALLEKQVAEQIEAINRAAKAQNAKLIQRKHPIKKPMLPQKQMLLNTGVGMSVGKSVPPLAPISPLKKAEVEISKTMQVKQAAQTMQQVHLQTHQSPMHTHQQQQQQPMQQQQRIIKEVKVDKVEKVEKPVEQKRTPHQLVIQDALGNQTTITEGQILALPSETVDGQPQSYMLVTLDETGNLTPLNNEALMSLDPNLNLGGDLSNMVLQIDQGTAAESAPEAPVVPVKEEKVVQQVVEQHVPQQHVQQQIQQSQLQQVLQQQLQPEIPEAAAVDPNAMQAVACSINNGETNQQLIITGDPLSTQKFLESLTEGNADLANLLANAEGNILIHADGQQILINTDSENQMLLTLNSDAAVVDSEGSGNPIFGSHPAKNQDILAAALAGTDVFPPDQTVLPKPQSQLSPGGPLYPMNVNNVLETSAMNSPIMTPLEIPSTNSKKIDHNAVILNQVPKNVDLPITITDPNISQTVAHSHQVALMSSDLHTNLDLPLAIQDVAVTSAEMNSPSFSYSLPSLDETVDIPKSFTGSISMPLLTEVVAEEIPTSSSIATTTTVEATLPNEIIQKPLEPQKNDNKFDEKFDDKFVDKLGEKLEAKEEYLLASTSLSMNNQMCSSLSEPPPDMFDFTFETKQDVVPVSETSDFLQVVNNEEIHECTVQDDSCEIPLQPEIITNVPDETNVISDFK